MEKEAVTVGEIVRTGITGHINGFQIARMCIKACRARKIAYVFKCGGTNP